MAYIAPNTDITLCRDVPLDSSYDHTVDFAAGSEAQFAYFYSKRYVTLQANSYQRVGRNRLRIACTMEQAIMCNYLYFNNHNFEDKIFYAFITGWEYVNNVTTEISYEIDVFQTFWNDVRLLQVFVEREHSNTDYIGENLVPETIEQGEYVVDGGGVCDPYEILNPTTGDPIVETTGSAIFYCTFSEREQSDPLYSTDPFPDFTGAVVDGVVYTGLCPIRKVGYGNPNDPTGIDGFISKVIAAGKKDGILAAYMCPYNPNTYDHITWSFNLDKHVTSLAGYVPKNKKLFTAPYNVLRVRTDTDTAEFKYELFNQAKCSFIMEGYIIPDPVLTLIPISYNSNPNTSPNRTCLEQRLTLKCFPQIAYDSDVWKVYFAQNGASLITGMIGAAAETGAKMLMLSQGGLSAGAPIVSAMADRTGNGHMTIRGSAPQAGSMYGSSIDPLSTLQAGSSLTGIAQSIAQIYEIQKKPPQLNGNQSALNDYAAGVKKFYYDYLCVRPQFARIIDDYFSMFGYATHIVKQPNITGRPYWNYVKTIGNTVDALGVPDPYLRKMNDAFNKGITIWHNPNNVGNYSLNNAPT